MNYNSIEKLTPEQIKEIYNNVIETNTENLYSSTYWFNVCDNGRQGFCYDSYYYPHPVGSCVYDVNYATATYYFCMSRTCGVGQWGYGCVR